MVNQKHTINAATFKGHDSGYACTSPDLPIVTQGASLDEAVSELQEAMELHFECETFAGLTVNPVIVITIKTENVTDNTWFYQNQ